MSVKARWRSDGAVVFKDAQQSLRGRDYIRYLHNGFREKWGFTGNPLRVLMRQKGGRNE